MNFRTQIAAATVLWVVTASAFAAEPPALVCPVRGTVVPSAAKAQFTSEWRSVRHIFCCAACKAAFDAGPEAALLKRPAGKLVGVGLFDPVSTQRIDPTRAASSVDVGGVRYYFATAASRKKFDRDPKRYVAKPAREVLYCPVNDKLIAAARDASDYSDRDGTRYYFCCAGCKPAFDANAAKYLAGIDGRIAKAKSEHGGPKLFGGK